MKKTNGIIIALSIVAAVLSAAALALSIIALVKSAGKGRISDNEYDLYDEGDLPGDYSDIECDDIGSDTLAF